MLEKYYKGDDVWNNFVSIFPKSSSIKPCEYYDELYRSLNYKEDLAIVIYELVGFENSLDWINKKNPALDGLRPIDCLECDLLNRLKVMLMRL